MDWDKLVKDRSASRPTKGKLSDDEVQGILHDVADGLSYFEAGRRRGVSGSTARYYVLREAKRQTSDR